MKRYRVRMGRHYENMWEGHGEAIRDAARLLNYPIIESRIEIHHLKELGGTHEWVLITVIDLDGIDE